MFSRQTAVVGLFLVLILSSMTAKADIDPPFDELHWKGRALVITGPQDNDLFKQQMLMLENNVKGMNDRDMVVVTFHNRDIDTYPELNAFPFDVPRMYQGGSSRDDERNLLESQLQTDDDIFSVVLVGKDGETKKVWREEEEIPVNPRDIFIFIDSMLMPRQEMQMKKEK